jgi:hypothetical protein
MVTKYGIVKEVNMKSPYGDDYINNSSIELLDWAGGIDDEVKAKKLVRIADKMERKYRDYAYKINF